MYFVCGSNGAVLSFQRIASFSTDRQTATNDEEDIEVRLVRVCSLFVPATYDFYRFPTKYGLGDSARLGGNGTSDSGRNDKRRKPKQV